MYIIVGGTGFLGSNIVRALLCRTNESILVAARKSVEYCLPDMSWGGNIQFIKCDVQKKEDLNKLIIKINSLEESCKIIFLAASLHPEEVERDSWSSWNTNVISLEYLLSSIKHVDIFLYASTDSVYGLGNHSHLFCEEDKVAPVNLYGTQKLAGEAIALHYGGKVFRYPLLLGPSIIKGRKHFYDSLVERLRDLQSVELFEDSYRSTLDFKTAAELTVRFIVEYAEEVPPILNIAGDEALSKYDVGIRIAKRLRVPESLVIPIRTANGGHIYSTPRAAVTLLDNTKMKQILALNEVIMQFEV